MRREQILVRDLEERAGEESMQGEEIRESERKERKD